MMMLVPGEEGGDDLTVFAEVEDEAWQHDLAVEDGGGPEAVLHADGVHVVADAQVRHVPLPRHLHAVDTRRYSVDMIFSR